MKAMISLCDVNIAKNIRPTWDYRQNVGEGTYSHYNSGGFAFINYSRNLPSSFSYRLEEWIGSSVFIPMWRYIRT